MTNNAVNQARGKTPLIQTISWALWDWGTSAFSVLITTFVFARYIVSDYFIDPDVVAAYKPRPDVTIEGGFEERVYNAASSALTANLGWALAIGGVVVAILAPIVGQRTDQGGRRRRWLGINTLVVIVATLAMFFVEGTPDFFIMGLVLITVATVFYEMANVNYNAMLLQISTPSNVGRISGFGWGLGYLGGIVVLVIALLGFILAEPYWFGVTDEGGMNIRFIALLAAVWSAIFAIPVLLFVPENTAVDPDAKLGIFASYAKVFRKVASLAKNAPETFYFLLASAVFRDGLVGVFTFGGILAGKVFGLSDTEVIFFAIGGNLIAGLGVFAGGVLDDRFSSKGVIVGSLLGLVISGTMLFILHDGGPMVFWVFGLLLTMFVGPAQAAARSLLARLAPEGGEGELFGLYATTGRAISFITPALFAFFVTLGGADYWGILGIVAVLALGLVLMLPLRLKFVR
ncbi:MAG: MFS transporter [Microbacteriaceae bacterium]|nr:MFS transporter [Microbacteriaceae bacterium]